MAEVICLACRSRATRLTIPGGLRVLAHGPDCPNNRPPDRRRRRDSANG
jgi:hypothetical protein